MGPRRRARMQAHALMLQRIANLETELAVSQATCEDLRINASRGRTELDAIEGSVDSWLSLTDGSGTLTIPRAVVYEVCQNLIHVQNTLSGDGDMNASGHEGTTNAMGDGVAVKFAEVKPIDERPSLFDRMGPFEGALSESFAPVKRAGEHTGLIDDMIYEVELHRDEVFQPITGLRRLRSRPLGQDMIACGSCDFAVQGWTADCETAMQIHWATEHEA